MEEQIKETLRIEIEDILFNSGLLSDAIKEALNDAIVAGEFAEILASSHRTAHLKKEAIKTFLKEYEITGGERRKQRAFLTAFLNTANVSRAAEASKVGRRTHYDWLENDELYKTAFEVAKEVAAEMLEEEARRRAVDGVYEPVFYKGVRCGQVLKYSDTLLIVLLKAAKPGVYKDRVEQENKGSITQKHEYSYMTDEELENELNKYRQADKRR